MTQSYKPSPVPNPLSAANQEANMAIFLNSILMAVNPCQIAVTPPLVLPVCLPARIFLLAMMASLLLGRSERPRWFPIVTNSLKTFLETLRQ